MNHITCDHGFHFAYFAYEFLFNHQKKLNFRLNIKTHDIK